MEGNTSIKIKAAFLLVVFALNTLVGFACSLGVNMGFNATHHHHEEAAAADDHSQHQDKLHHHHDEADNHHHKSKAGKENCCNNEVVKFAQVDKAAPHSLNMGISPIFLTAFVSLFYNIDVLSTFKALTSIKYFVRSHHPPIPDIRIAIRSFQI